MSSGEINNPTLLLQFWAAGVPNPRNLTGPSGFI